MIPRAIVETPCRDLKESIAFYERLGFRRCGERPLLFDGRLHIRINESRFARTALVLGAEAVESAAGIAELQEVDERKIVTDPNGVRVCFDDAVGSSLDALAEPFGVLGRFAGLSIETARPTESMTFWTALGYAPSMGDIQEQGWVQLSADNGVDISLMRVGACPHLFPMPGLTYFNGGKNPEIIPKIAAARVPFSQEITWFNKEGAVDNVIIHDPGFTGFFIFND